MPHIVDYFTVCGLHSDVFESSQTPGIHVHSAPLGRPYTCTVLSRYPDKDLTWNPFDESAVKTLCMPEGLVIKKNLEDPSTKFFHSFLITRENGTRAYGSVLTYYEPLEDTRVLNTLESLQTKYRQSRRTPVNLDEMNCFDQATDRLYVSKCLCFVSSRPIFRPCEAYLEQLYAVTVGGRNVNELPLESYLYNLLYEVPMPSPGKSVKFYGPLGRLTWYLPSRTELPLCDYGFKGVFELLGVTNIIKLITCMLLEHQVLFKSSDYERLMQCTHCTMILMFPFAWPHVFVPILPASQRGFLDAPVPYIMGLKIDSSEAKYLNLPNVASLCTVDIDSGALECPDELPGMPNEERLISQVTEKLVEHGVSCSDLTELPRSPDSLMRKPSIIEAIRLMKELSDSSDLKKILSETGTNPHLPNLINIATRAGIKTPLSPTLSVDEGTYDLDEETDDAKKGEWDFAPDEMEDKFATAVREVFANYFVEHFANYESFIIVPNQSYDQWVRNRDQFQNFDKTAFLSDQPTNYRPFYSAFVETTMFTGFIDDKIVTFWEPDKAGHNLSLFDSRVDQYRTKSGLPQLPTKPGSRSESLSSDAGHIDSNGDVIDENAPLPHPLSKDGRTLTSPTPSHQSNASRCFPKLDSSLLQMSGSDVNDSLLESPDKSNIKSGLKASDGKRMALSTASPTFARLRRNRSGSTSGSGAGGTGGFSFSSHSHAKFVNQLMRESRLRVKHMLGSSGDTNNSIEENTHIAYLCDLLERIWGQGLKKRESKSPLWAHLMAYAETVGKDEFKSATTMGPSSAAAFHAPPLTASMSSLSTLTTSSTRGSTSTGEESPRTSQNLRAHFRRKKFHSPQLRSRIEAILRPPSSSLVSDLLIIHNMRELKTDVGRARAWVRLALEKKSLSRQLSQLLSQEELSNRRYREYAFVRTDEEREQFLYHLLTLTARDFSCFTTAFLRTTMSYRILVIGEGKHFGLSTACLYVNLGGEFGETGVTEIARGEYQTDITCHNIGPLTSLRIGHDNSGITPSLFVEMVLVHNVTTGQTYRFNCGCWFARSEDDGSIERFLVAEKIPQTIAKSGTMSALDVDSVLPTSPSRRRANKREAEEKPVLNDLKFDLKLCMDKIRTLAMGKNKDINQEMLQLVHGPRGFIRCIEQVFYYGFRSSRKFQKKLYVWDLLEKVHEHLQSGETTTHTPSDVTALLQVSGLVPSADTQRRGSAGLPSPDPETQCRDMFLNAIARINTNNTSIGKDEKAIRFFSLGLRDHFLAGWVSLIAQSSVVVNFYDPVSFLRDYELLQNLIDTLQLTHTLPIRLEPLLTQGL